MPKDGVLTYASLTAKLGYASEDKLRLVTAKDLVDAGLGAVRPFAPKYSDASHPHIPPDLLWSLLGLGPGQLEDIHSWVRENHPRALTMPPRRQNQRHSGGKVFHQTNDMYPASATPFTSYYAA